MKIVCSWCRKEGKAGIVGEKAPLDDARETHGIHPSRPCLRLLCPRLAWLLGPLLLVGLSGCEGATSDHSPLTVTAKATTYYYVDPDWAGTQTGEAATPWVSLASSQWTTINTAL